MRKISVNICTFNGAKRITVTLESLIKQKLNPVEFEIIVIDNASTDNTAQIVKGVKEKYPQFEIKYSYEKQTGKSYALNKGIKESHGEILAFIDDDAIADENWLSSIKEAFYSTTAACVGGKVIPLWDNTCPAWLKGKASLFIPSFDWGEEIKLFNPPTNFPCGTNMAIKQAVVHKIGLFDTNLGHESGRLIGSEETDYCLRIFADNGLLIYYPKAIVYHPLNERQVSKSYLRNRSFTQGTASAYIYSKGGKLFTLLVQKIKNLIRRQKGPNIICETKKQFDSFYLELKLIFYLGYMYGAICKKVVPAKRTMLSR